MDSGDQIKALIRKYLNQECSPPEMDTLRKAMELPEIQTLFDEVISEGYPGLQAELDVEQFHLEERLQQFHQKLQQQSSVNPAPEQVVVKTLKRRKYYFPAAAIWIVFVMGLGIYGLMNYSKEKPEVKPTQIAVRTVDNPLGQRATVILPDSSTVYLGAGSKLRMPDHFTGNTREVELEGEAFFKVTKDPKKPFIIHTGTVQTKVLGTSFKIEAFNGAPLTVAVATGKVRVDDYAGGGAGRSLAVLIPGQKISYEKNIATASLVDTGEVGAWKDAKLVFHQRKLSEITTALARWYAVDISFQNNTKANERISVSLQADVPLNKIMKVLSATAQFNYTIKGKTVHIR